MLITYFVLLIQFRPTEHSKIPASEDIVKQMMENVTQWLLTNTSLV